VPTVLTSSVYQPFVSPLLTLVNCSVSGLQVGVEWEIIGKEKLMVDEAAVLVLNHQAGANTPQLELVAFAVLRIRDVYPDPDFCPSRIIDPESKNSNKRGGGKRFVALPFFVATNLTKLTIFLTGTEKYFEAMDNTFYRKNCLLALRNICWVSEIRDSEKTYPGSRGQKSTGFRIRKPLICMLSIDQLTIWI
jgi:hypothetical protein